MVSWADLAILVVVLLSALLSLWRGTLREGLSLTVWLLALGGGFILMVPIMPRLEPHVSVFAVRIILAFGGGFLATLIAGGLLNIIILQVLKPRRPSTMDRLLGTPLGLLRGLFAVVVLVFLASFTSLPEDNWWQNSPLLQRLTPVVSWLQGFMPVDLEPTPVPADVDGATSGAATTTS